MSLYALMAELVDYPGPKLPGALDESIEILARLLPAASGLLGHFRAFVHAHGLAQLEEIYTHTFDFRSDSSLYVGHHLFGEDSRRNLFIARLKQRHRELKFPGGVEMPDHLSLVLRFLAVQPPGEEAAEMVEQCLIPAVSKMAEAVRGKEPYGDVLSALLQVLYRGAREQSEAKESAWQTFCSSSSPMSR